MRTGLASIGLVVLAILAGCGRSGPKTVEVSGTVKVKGKAVEGVEVQFVGEKFAGVGKTDAQGKFRLASGAMPGRNKVCFRKFDTGQLTEDSKAGMDAGQFAAMQQAQGSAAKVKQLIPAEYSDPATTKMEFNVPANGTTSADFDL